MSTRVGTLTSPKYGPAIFVTEAEQEKHFDKTIWELNIPTLCYDQIIAYQKTRDEQIQDLTEEISTNNRYYETVKGTCNFFKKITTFFLTWIGNKSCEKEIAAVNKKVDEQIQRINEFLTLYYKERKAMSGLGW